MIPGFSIKDELEQLYEAGLSNYEALQSAILNISREVGTVSKGEIRNLVLLNANPLENIDSAFLAGRRSAVREMDSERHLAGRTGRPLEDSVERPIPCAADSRFDRRLPTIDSEILCISMRSRAVVSFVVSAACHPAALGKYVLAIECDGATDHSSYTARDRDRLRQQQLEKLGWTFHRIWSTDWFLRREEEIDRAVQAFHKAVEKSDGDGETSWDVGRSTSQDHIVIEPIGILRYANSADAAYPRTQFDRRIHFGRIAEPSPLGKI